MRSCTSGRLAYVCAQLTGCCMLACLVSRLDMDEPRVEEV